MLFLLLRTVVLTIDVADVMAAVSIGIATEERRTFSLTRAIDEPLGSRMHGPHVLSIHAFRLHAEGSGTGRDITRRGLRVVGVFVVEIVLAGVDHGQLPELRQVHYLVEDTLSQCALPEEANYDSARAETLSGKCRPGGDAHAPRHDGVRAQVASRGVGNVHRSTFAPAVSRFFAQQLGKHAVRRRPFGQTVPVATMRAGDVVISAERFADPNRYPFFAHIQVCETRHQGASVELIHLLLEQANAHHTPVHPEPLFDAGRGIGLGRLSGNRHFATPDIRANTSKITAKSCFARPMARAAVRNSFDTAVVGKETSS